MSLWSTLFGWKKSRLEFNDSGSFAVEVVGESHFQSELKRLCGGYAGHSQCIRVTATLLLDDNNPHDNKAVQVHVGNKQVGHLSRQDARKYRRMLSNLGRPTSAGTCEAEIVGGWKRSRKDIGKFGVRLDLPI